MTTTATIRKVFNTGDIVRKGNGTTLYAVIETAEDGYFGPRQFVRVAMLKSKSQRGGDFADARNFRLVRRTAA